MPIISDVVYMTEQAYMVIAGAALIKGGKSQNITSLTIGGPDIHVHISNCADFRGPDDESVLALIRRDVAMLPSTASTAASTTISCHSAAVNTGICRSGRPVGIGPMRRMSLSASRYPCGAVPLSASAPPCGWGILIWPVRSLLQMTLPVSALKIDRCFVGDMEHSDNDAVIVNTVKGLAHDLGMAVVAEGVEDNETLITLKVIDCDYAQGFYICSRNALSRPKHADFFSKDSLHWNFWTVSVIAASCRVLPC